MLDRIGRTKRQYLQQHPSDDPDDYEILTFKSRRELHQWVQRELTSLHGGVGRHYTGIPYAQMARVGGLSGTTIANMAKGKTFRPGDYTIDGGLKALGAEQVARVPKRRL